MIVLGYDRMLGTLWAQQFVRYFLDGEEHIEEGPSTPFAPNAIRHPAVLRDEMKNCGFILPDPEFWEHLSDERMYERAWHDKERLLRGLMMAASHMAIDAGNLEIDLTAE